LPAVSKSFSRLKLDTRNNRDIGGGMIQFARKAPTCAGAHNRKLDTRKNPSHLRP
jgi:hypothetical protein